MILQLANVIKMASVFFVYSTMYMLNPHSEMGIFLTKPFVKFVCHSASYATFLGGFEFFKAKNRENVGCINSLFFYFIAQVCWL